MSEGVYKGVRIDIHVYELKDDGQFSAKITLVRRSGGADVETMYHPEGSFMTKDLAKEAALQHAFLLIDKE